MEQVDIQGRALLDYFLGKEEVHLKLYTSYGVEEEMPVDVFFREREDFSKLERLALRSCRGKVLDVGAGAGSFALELQQEGLPVKALELSPLSCHIMRQRGVREVVEADFWQFKQEKFDALLLMMNGLGLAGTLSNLTALLRHLKELLLPGGQIICDSSDITYLYMGTGLPEDDYYGEISYCYEYEEEQGEWFRWLYVDANTLAVYCEAVGLRLQVLYTNKYEQYLARITLK